jgi:hypothetical protein
MVAHPATKTQVTRFGVHHQPTKLAVQFNGAVSASQAGNPANYAITLRGPDGVFGTTDDVTVPIIAAVYSPSANAALLTSARRLNFRDRFELAVQLGTIANSGAGAGNDPVVLFGGKQDLGGVVGNHGRGTALLPLPSDPPSFGKDAAPISALGPLAEPAARIRIPARKIHLTAAGSHSRGSPAGR